MFDQFFEAMVLAGEFLCALLVVESLRIAQGGFHFSEALGEPVNVRFKIHTPENDTARDVTNTAGGETRKKLLLFLFAVRGGGLSGLGLGDALLKLIHSSGGIDEFLHPGIKGMTDIADPDQDRRLRRTSFDDIAAGAADLCVDVLRMSISFHKNEPRSLAAD